MKWKYRILKKSNHKVNCNENNRVILIINNIVSNINVQSSLYWDGMEETASAVCTALALNPVPTAGLHTLCLRADKHHLSWPLQLGYRHLWEESNLWYFTSKASSPQYTEFLPDAILTHQSRNKSVKKYNHYRWELFLGCIKVKWYFTNV